MREYTGIPETQPGIVNLNTNEIHLKDIYTLDDIPDGASYERVLATDITAGHILLSSVTQSASYRTVDDTEKGVWNGKPDDFDELGEGVTYKKILATQISSGRIILTAANYYSGKFTGEWYSMGTESGVDIDAVNGINIYGKNNALTTRATKAGAVQCYVGTDGAIYAGAGAIKMNADGFYIYGVKLLLHDGVTPFAQKGEMGYQTSTSSVYLASLAGVAFILTGSGGLTLSGASNPIVFSDHLVPSSTLARNLGAADKVLLRAYIETIWNTTEIGPYSDSAVSLYLACRDSGGFGKEQKFSPRVNLYGYLGDTTHRWIEGWVKEWKGVTNLDPASDGIAYLYFVTRNIANTLDVDHVLSPYTDAHGRLGDATRRWLSHHVVTITPGTIDFPTTDVTDCLDEDNMASNSATKLATQQSIKAYVDGKTSGLTSGRVVIAGAAGALTDDADMTFSTDTLTVTKIVASARLKIPVGINLYG